MVLSDVQSVYYKMSPGDFGRAVSTYFGSLSMAETVHCFNHNTSGTFYEERHVVVLTMVPLKARYLMPALHIGQHVGKRAGSATGPMCRTGVGALAVGI